MNKFLLPLLFIIITITSWCLKNDNKNFWDWYFSYKNKIYYNSTGSEVIWADIDTFIVLYKDNHCGDIKIFAKDKNNVYWEDKVLFTGFDYTTLTGKENCMRWCFQDKEASYYHENTPELAYKKDTTKQFPEEFIVNQNILPTWAIELWGWYFVYQEDIYLNSTGNKIIWADKNSFTFLYKDKQCWEWPHTFGKDKNNVYWDFRILFSWFDYKTLTEERNCIRWCFKDKDASYYFDWCDENWCLYIKDPSFTYPTKRK